MQLFARDYMAGYNQRDTDALKGMYSEYVSRTDQQGNEMVGANAVMEYLSSQFSLNDATLLLHQSSVHWSEAERAWVALGTYEINGKTIVYDIDVHTTGTYTNTMIRDKDQWKIAKTVLTPIVKVVVYHEVKDFAQWKPAFNQGLPALREAGGRNCEIGMLQGDPNTAYVISEWPSVEAFQSFFSNPKLKESMGEAGVVGKPTILILDRQ
jgi:ketosteroid isomerase-like protein